MKIAHLTLLHGYNFGGILQAYATQEILRSRGHDVITLDYHPAKRIQLIRRLCLNIRSFHEPLGRLIDKCKFSGEVQFHAFRQEYFIFSAPCVGGIDLERACHGIDMVVVGSDQVWSSTWLRKPYFIDFNIPDGCKTVSLAACVGIPSNDPSYIAYASRTLARFDTISVRNNFSAAMVQKATGKTPVILCDPTLVTELPRTALPGVSGDYILAYVINRPRSIPIAIEVINQFRDQTGLLTLSIPPAECKGKCSIGADQILAEISPFQWIHLISSARHLITDSLHGVLFALKYEVDFSVLSNTSEKFSRIHSLLADFGLSKRIITSVTSGQKILAPISCNQWQEVREQIAFRKKEYLGFVDQMFDGT